MSERQTKMDQAAKSRIMSSEYKSNQGMATNWSRRAQSAADRNYPQHGQSGSYYGGQGADDSSGWWCTIL